MEVNSQDLIQILSDNIKLYEHLGIEVQELNSHRAVFKVSLEKNLNHKGTAFGGSLYASGVLSAYALVLAGLKHYKIDTENIVIAKGSIEYHRPVETDFEIRCAFKDEAEEKNFYKELQEKKRVRADLHVQILGEGGSLRASLVGAFVVRM
ncbi:MAG: YiiD C-terminal domain-containing protein [Bdellovibrio sp.]|nr:YiiD C-terminal domain-containing protein [Bdellovibrio sp.]